MAEKKVIDIEVKSNIQKTINELNSLETNLEDVRDEAGKTSKSIDDVAGNGGAIAILDQLTGGLASQFKNAYESTKLFNLSLKGTKSALIATGIGALVVALGAIVAYWDDIVEFVNGTNKALQKQNESLKQNTDFLDARLKTLEAEKKSLEAQGKSTKGILELQNTLLTQKRELLKLQLINLETQLKEEESVVKKVSLWEKIKVSALTAAGLYKQAANATAESVIGNDEERKSINDKKIAIEQLKTSLAELTLAQTELNKPKETGAPVKEKSTADEKAQEILDKEKKLQDELKKIRDADEEERQNYLLQIENIENEYFNRKKTKEELELEAVDEKYFLLLEKARQYGQDTAILEEEQELLRNEIKEKYENERIEKSKKNAEEEAKIEKEKIASKQAAVNAIAELAGAETGIGKALLIAKQALALQESLMDIKRITFKGTQAIGEAGVATSQNVAESSKIGFPQNIVTIAAAIAQGASIISSVKKAVSKTKANASSISASVPSVRSGAQAQAPSFNIVGQSGINQLSEAIGTKESKPIKAYVTSNDVTTAQGLDRNIVQGATIG
jgi:hypothetical protein